MKRFSDDVDILKYEPRLFKDLYPVDQVLCSGEDATLSGTTLVKFGENFLKKKVTAGNVVYLKSATLGIDRVMEIKSIGGVDNITISVVRNSTTDDAITLDADGYDYQYRIATFNPQACNVMRELTEYFSISPGNPDSKYSINDLLDANVLRQVSTFAVISGVYAALAQGINGSDAYWDKSFYYRKKFRQALAKCKVDIDLGKDGIKDLTRYANSPRLLRD